MMISRTITSISTGHLLILNPSEAVSTQHPPRRPFNDYIHQSPISLISLRTSGVVNTYWVDLFLLFLWLLSPLLRQGFLLFDLWLGSSSFAHVSRATFRSRCLWARQILHIIQCVLQKLITIELQQSLPQHRWSQLANTVILRKVLALLEQVDQEKLQRLLDQRWDEVR